MEASVHKGDICDFQASEIKDGTPIHEGIHIGVVVHETYNDVIKGIVLYVDGVKLPMDDCFAIDLMKKSETLTLMNSNGISELEVFEAVGVGTEVPFAPKFFQRVKDEVGNQALFILAKIIPHAEATKHEEG